MANYNYGKIKEKQKKENVNLPKRQKPLWQRLRNRRSVQRLFREEEPSLLQIKGIPTDIQETVSSIRQENSKLKKDMAELKSSLQSSEWKLQALQTALN